MFGYGFSLDCVRISVFILPSLLDERPIARQCSVRNSGVDTVKEERKNDVDDDDDDDDDDDVVLGGVKTEKPLNKPHDQCGIFLIERRSMRDRNKMCLGNCHAQSRIDVLKDRPSYT